MPSRLACGRVPTRCPTWARIAVAASLLALPDTAIRAQSGSIAGTVTGPDDRPIAGAEVLLDGVMTRVFANDRGQYQFRKVDAGTHVVSVRRVGFQPYTDTVTVAAGAEVQRPIRLQRMTQLDSVSVTARRLDPGMADFEDHRRVGLGRFLDRAELARNEGRRLADVLRTVSGVRIMQGPANRAFIQSSRAPVDLAPCIPIDESRSTRQRAENGNRFVPTRAEARFGMRCGCYPQVYRDKALMNASMPTEPFDVNEIPTEEIEAVEWYAGASQLPSEYARLQSTCGVLVIHTRRPPG